MTRVGWGYDSHRFARGRALVLGGVPIPGARGLKGHSDGDAALHALIDALLGAAALGDIGTFFPDTDPRFKNAESLRLLKHALKLITPRFKPAHVDLTILTEEPRIGPYRQRMRAKIARALDLPLDRVSVKAKTNEGMGFIGKREGLAATAVAVLEEKRHKK